MSKFPSPLKAIRAKCLDCSDQSAHEVRNCPITDCPLYMYRDGHNPNRKGIGNKHIDDARLFAKSVGELGNYSTDEVPNETVHSRGTVEDIESP